MEQEVVLTLITNTSKKEVLVRVEVQVVVVHKVRVKVPNKVEPNMYLRDQQEQAIQHKEEIRVEWAVKVRISTKIRINTNRKAKAKIKITQTTNKAATKAIRKALDNTKTTKIGKEVKVVRLIL